MDDGPTEPARDLPSLRASDSEREATALLLQRSYTEGRLTLAEFDERTTRAYGARFQSDLAELTRDLAPAHQGDGSRTVQHTAPVPPPVRRVTGGSGPARSLALMGGCDRAGGWTVTDGHTAVAVMGGITLDLRQAGLQSQDVTIRAFAFMGGIEIVVPDDVHLDVDGIGVMGGFGEEPDAYSGGGDRRPVRQAPPGAPRVRITGLAVWAGVGIRRVPAAPH